MLLLVHVKIGFGPVVRWLATEALEVSLLRLLAVHPFHDELWLFRRHALLILHAVFLSSIRPLVVELEEPADKLLFVLALA